MVTVGIAVAVGWLLWVGRSGLVTVCRSLWIGCCGLVILRLLL